MEFCFGQSFLYHLKSCLQIDASLTGCGGFIQGSSFVGHKNWSAEESQKSSTWKELIAISFAVEAFDNHLAGQAVTCNTDNQNVVRIIQAGSMVKELQDIALSVFLFTSQRQIHLNVSWLPRDQNSQADFLSKIVDFNDYSLHDEVFFHLENLWLVVIMRNCLGLIPDSSNPVPKLLTPSHRTGHLRIIGWCHQYLSLAGY